MFVKKNFLSSTEGIYAMNVNTFAMLDVCDYSLQLILFCYAEKESPIPPSADIVGAATCPAGQTNCTEPILDKPHAGEFKL